MDGWHLYTLERGRKDNGRIEKGIRYESAKDERAPPYGLSRLIPWLCIPVEGYFKYAYPSENGTAYGFALGVGQLFFE